MQTIKWVNESQGHFLTLAQGHLCMENLLFSETAEPFLTKFVWKWKLIAMMLVTEAVLTSTHDLCFIAKLRKQMYTRVNPSFTIWAATWENRIFAYAKTKTQISFAVTAKLISAFVFATSIVQFLCFLNPKFQVSSHLLWLYSPVCVGPGRKPRRPVFWRRGSFYGLSWW